MSAINRARDAKRAQKRIHETRNRITRAFMANEHPAHRSTKKRIKLEVQAAFDKLRNTRGKK